MDVMRIQAPAEMLRLTERALANAGAEGELTYGILNRLADTPDAYGEQLILLAMIDGEDVVAVVTMTGLHPAIIVGFTDPSDVACEAFVRAMSGDGVRPPGINGSRRWSDPFAAAWQRVGGAHVEQMRQLRAFELRSVRLPTVVPAGRMRLARADEAELISRWARAFSAEALGEDESAEDASSRVERLMATDDVVVWEDSGVAVSMAAVSRRTPRSSCVSLVYTPPDRRCAGYASGAVAALSQRELDAGQKWCSLFTDVANPTSNHIYVEIGYESRCDFVHHALQFP